MSIAAARTAFVVDFMELPVVAADHVDLGQPANDSQPLVRRRRRLMMDFHRSLPASMDIFPFWRP